MSDRLDTSLLDDAMHYASREARHSVADALAAHLHNDGYALEGNTEANDVEWFARNLWAQDAGNTAADFDRPYVAENVREQWRRAARAVLAVLPAFQLRVAHRLITLSKVVRDIERAERQQRQQRQRAEATS